MALRKLKPLPKPEPPRRDDGPKAPPVHDESNWLVSYADMMTLLCGFFIMMFSLSTLDQPKFEGMKEAIAKQFGGQYKSPTEELTKFVTQVLDQNGVSKEAMIQSDAFGVSIGFQSTLFFDTLSSEVKAEGQAILNKLIASIADKQKNEQQLYRIVVEGHTDSRPIIGGPYPSNWELSSARAARVVRMFLDQSFAADHLTAIGYADTYPQVPSRTSGGAQDDAALAKNRRVVIRILQPKVDAIPFPSNGAKPLTVAQPESAAPAVDSAH